jgi:hypothetical protein
MRVSAKISGTSASKSAKLQQPGTYKKLEIFRLLALLPDSMVLARVGPAARTSGR